MLSKSLEDIDILKGKLVLYEKASSAKVNWEKCDGILLGQRSGINQPVLPAGLQWSREGMRVLRVFLGNSEFEKNKKQNKYNLQQCG